MEEREASLHCSQQGCLGWLRSGATWLSRAPPSPGDHPPLPSPAFSRGVHGGTTTCLTSHKPSSLPPAACCLVPPPGHCAAFPPPNWGVPTTHCPPDADRPLPRLGPVCGAGDQQGVTTRE